MHERRLWSPGQGFRFSVPSFSLSLSFLVGESKHLLPSVQGASLIDRTPPEPRLGPSSPEKLSITSQARLMQRPGSRILLPLWSSVSSSKVPVLVSFSRSYRELSLITGPIMNLFKLEVKLYLPHLPSVNKVGT